MSKRVTNLREHQYDKFVSEGIVLIEFWAPYCEHYKTMIQILDNLSVEIKNPDFKIGRVNVNENRKLCNYLGVDYVPTFVIYEKGKVFTLLRGMQMKHELLEILRNTGLNKNF